MAARHFPGPHERSIVVSQKHADKAFWVLRAFTAGEIQSHTQVQRARRIGTKEKSEIVTRAEHVKATGIPASIISKFQDGIWKPRERSLKKLSKFYDRYMYNQFQAHGANKKDARKYSRSDPVTAASLLRKYSIWAHRIQKNNLTAGRMDVQDKHIRWGMARSEHDFNEWEMLSRISGLQKRIPKKRRGYGYHRGG